MSFACAVQVPISPTAYQNRPYENLKFLLAFDLVFIIMYIEPLTSDLFLAYFGYCHFDELIFAILEGPKLHSEK